MTEEIQLRIHGDASLPTLIYLPGLHGDWTIIGGFRRALAGRVRFVELTYPRTLDWSLDDYAAGIETALAKNGITTGWLLGESYGSQIVWPLVAHGKFPAQGVILAGGFGQHPMRGAVRLAETLTGKIPLALIVWIIFSYAKVARFRFRRSPETLATLDEFVARRTDLDRRAAQHRLHLIAANDPRASAMKTRLPVFGLTGWLDPIVPWPLARRWLKNNCPALREYKIIPRADHNVLGTASRAAAEQILKWMENVPDASLTAPA